ncbi:MAG: hypothetical protein K2Z81_17120 [Cyanobacteria bacterium]|nr:hypothetical protein [Cyanobacteriota bacterium]
MLTENTNLITTDALNFSSPLTTFSQRWGEITADLHSPPAGRRDDSALFCDGGPNGDNDDNVDDSPAQDDQESPSGRKETFPQGTMYVDERNGDLNAITYTSGDRNGQNWGFQRGENGQVDQINIHVPGKDGAADSDVTMTRTGENSWRVAPPDAQIPGFNTVQRDAQGNITGDFNVKDDGTMVYDNGKGVKETVSADGTNTVIDLNDYSRSVNGGKKQYWDGYEFRDGEKTALPDGRVEVTFAKESGKPTKITRDTRTTESGGRSDGLKVEFEGGTKYEVDWSSQSMSRTDGSGNEVKLYNSGLTNSDNGKPLYLEGKPAKDADGKDYISFEGARHDSIADSDMPKGVRIREGKVTALYGNGMEVTHDRNGREEEIKQPNGNKVKIHRDAQGDISSVEGLDGKTYERVGTQQSGDSEVPVWKEKGAGEEADEIAGNISLLGRDGKILEIQSPNQGGPSLSLESDGSVIIRRNGEMTPAAGTGGEADIPAELKAMGEAMGLSADQMRSIGEVAKLLGWNGDTLRQFGEVFAKHGLTNPDFLRGLGTTVKEGLGKFLDPSNRGESLEKSLEFLRQNQQLLREKFTPENIDKFLTTMEQLNLDPEKGAETVAERLPEGINPEFKQVIQTMMKQVFEQLRKNHRD